MNFNPDPNKRAQEVIFCRKINKINHPPLLFNKKSNQIIKSQIIFLPKTSRNGIKHQIRLQFKSKKRTKQGK